MLWFDILVPAAALAVAGLGVLYIRHESVKLDREGRKPRHSAE